MKNPKKRKRLFRFFKFLYIKLFRIHDSPQRIALGLAFGVFSGIIPGIGPLTAIFLALIFHANRAAALLGSLLTNTWLSIMIFFLSVEIGSGIMGGSCGEVEQNWIEFIKSFSWRDLGKSSVLKAICPVVVGYLVIALCSGLLVYLIALIITARRKR